MKIRVAQSAVEELRDLHVDDASLRKMFTDLQDERPSPMEHRLVDLVDGVKIVRVGATRNLVAIVQDQASDTGDSNRILLGVKTLKDFSRGGPDGTTKREGLRREKGS